MATIGAHFQEAEREAGALFMGGEGKTVSVALRKSDAPALPTQGGEEDEEEEITDEDAERLRDSLAALLSQLYPRWWKIMFGNRTETPSLDELINFFALMKSDNPYDRLFAGLAVNPFELLFWQPLAIFPEAWAEGLKKRDHAASWDAFMTWLKEEGIGIFNDPAGVLIALERWLTGRGEGIDVLIAAAPIIPPSAFRAILDVIGDRAARESLENVARQLPDGTYRVDLWHLMGVLAQNGDEIAQRNFLRLMETLNGLDPKDAERVLRGISQDDLLRLISDRNLLDNLPPSATKEHIWGTIKAEPGVDPERFGHLSYDPKRRQFSLEEGRVALRIESSRNITLERFDENIHYGKEGDWIERLNNGQLRSYDAVGPISEGVPYKLDQFKSQISEHLTKDGVDVVVVDLAGLSQADADAVRNYISTISIPADKELIVFP